MNDIDNMLDKITENCNREETEIFRDSLTEQIQELNKNLNIIQQQNNVLIETEMNTKHKIGCIGYMIFIICIPIIFSIIFLILKLIAGFSIIESLSILF